MNVVIASDHAGFAMKEALRHWLKEKGYHVEDAGPFDDGRVDYPDFAAQACDRLRKGWPTAPCWYAAAASAWP